MNKDPKKSKYSDTLHRFCKKEHDWGWKKFMELSKVLDGFTVADTLVIKAQVQVIHEKPARPFRCLEPQYRRELVRVYLTNVEGICRRFLEERRDQLAKFQEDETRWADMREFLGTAQGKAQALLASEKADVLLKGIVKRFFNEKEVTSTLVMDALCCGCQALDIGSSSAEDACKQFVKGRSVWLSSSQNKCSIATDDLLSVLERAANPDLLDPDANDSTNDANAEFGDDAVERDERRLADLGRRTVEMYALSHLFTVKIEVAFAEAQAIKMQEALIAEEEEAERVAAEIDGAKKSKKAKQKQRKKEKKEAEEAEAAARLAEEEAAKAAVRAAEEAKRAEERRRREAELALIAEAEAREQAEQAAAAAAAAAVKAAEAAARAAEQARIDAEREAAERAAKEAELESSSADDSEMVSAPGSNETDSEEAVTPTNVSPPKHQSASSFGAYDSPGLSGAAKKNIPTPRPLASAGSSPAGLDSLPGTPQRPGADGFEDPKKGKKSSAASKEAPQPSPKKQLPSPRTGGGDGPGGTANGGRAAAPTEGGAARSPEVARTMQGDGPLSAVEAAGLRAHTLTLESENARLRTQLARALAQLEVGGPSAGGVAVGTPPQSPARGGEDAAKAPNGVVVAGIAAKAGSAAAAAGPPPPPGPPPPGASRAAPPLPPARVPSRLRTAPAPRPLPPARPPRAARHLRARPGWSDRSRGSPGRMADRRRGRAPASRRPRRGRAAGPRRGCPRRPRRVHPRLGVGLRRRRPACPRRFPRARPRPGCKPRRTRRWARPRAGTSPTCSRRGSRTTSCTSA